MMEGNPQRGDVVDQWLKRQRDEYENGSQAWIALDDALDSYRLHADTGTELDSEVEEH